MDDDAIRDVVVRLSRPDGQGGHVIERGAIRAEGGHLAAIETWILAHGGAPEALPAAVASGGLHGGSRDVGGAPASPPLRYVLPAGWLAADDHEPPETAGPDLS